MNPHFPECPIQEESISAVRDAVNGKSKYGSRLLWNCHKIVADISQCDRASPICRRCTIHGVPCPGYPQSQDVIFRHETLKTVRKASAEAVPEAASVFAEQTSIHTVSAARKMVIQPQIYDSLRLSDTVTSTCYFIHQVVIPVGWFSLIPKLYQDSDERGCIKRAVEAASMFLFANRTGKGQLLVWARKLYSSALTATNIAISDPFESLRDETFCAILVLNIIDVGAVQNQGIGISVN